MIVKQVTTLETEFKKIMSEIQKNLIQITALRNNPMANLATVNLALVSLEDDLRCNVLNAMQNAVVSADVKQQANKLKAKTLETRAQLNMNTTGSDLYLDRSSKADIKESWIRFDQLQAQGQRLVAGELVYPSFLASYKNTCTDAALCTAAFLLNQEHQVDRTRLRSDGNNEFDLFEAAFNVDSSWTPKMHQAFDSSLFSQLNSTQIYIVRNGLQGGGGHFAIWFNVCDNWYQSKDPSVPLLQLTDRGRITSQAKQYFSLQSKGFSWGNNFGEYGIQLLSLFSGDIFPLFSQKVSEMKSK